MRRRNDASPAAERAFDEHVRRENTREGQPLTNGAPSPALLRDDTAESLRRYLMACRRAMDDPGHLLHVEAWANGVLRNPSLGHETSYAREIVRRLATIRETGCDHVLALREALKLGALLEEHHLRFGWKRDAVAGRKSRSQGPRGREGGHLGGRKSMLEPERERQLLALSPSQRSREMETIAFEDGIRVESVKRRLARARAKARAKKSAK